jgi:hypothetical protein
MVFSKKLVRISIGFVIGIVGLSLMLLGATLPNVWLLRSGIAVTTIGGWTISWN